MFFGFFRIGGAREIYLSGDHPEDEWCTWCKQRGSVEGV